MTEYKVIKTFSMDFRRKRNYADYSDTITLEKGQILEVIDSINLVFRIKGTKIGLRLDPFTIEHCLKEVRRK